MDTNSGYKDRALESLNGNWGTGVVAVLITGAILCIPTYSIALFTESIYMNQLSNLWSVAMLPLQWGLTVLFLTIVREQQASYEQLFDGFKNYWHILGTLFLKNLYIGLWILLLIVPGIIKYYSYSMTEYILKDHPDLGANEAIEKSMEMMDGHKMDLFLLQLSFIGWMILSCLTLGLGFILLWPYMSTAMAHFYEDLKKEYKLSGEE